MKSIRARILLLTIAAVLVSVTTIGTICLVAFRAESERKSLNEMRMICYERSVTINDYLERISLSLDIVSDFAMQELDAGVLAKGGVLGVDGWSGRTAEHGDGASQRQKDLDAYLHDHCARVENALLSAANRNDGMITFYYRINPEISLDETGFLYSRIGGGEFERIEATDISAYKPDDMEHVGWYYEPLRRGCASWLDPYDNENLDIKMISYVAPLYKEDTFLGIIGVDISFETLVNMIRDIRLYKTDYAFLATQDGHIIYHPTLPTGFRHEEYIPGLTEAFGMMQMEDSNVEPIRYTLDGVKRQMFYSTILSGQKLLVSAPVAEINESWTQLWPELAGALLTVLFLFTLIAYFSVRHITNPLKRLTAASRSLAEGDYSIQLEYDGDDEVGMLTRAFRHLVGRLKDYINDLNSMAYRDAMTGVKNKAAYDISAQKLNDLIQLSGAAQQPSFAVVMLDCNDLKRINDNYGHEKGDAYLQTACKLICDVFNHSPVFRLGGDEFSVLLAEESYHDRDYLMRKFDECAAKINDAAKEPWETVHIAKGLAVYDPASDPDVEHVMRRADQLMYEDKKRCKEGASQGGV